MEERDRITSSIIGSAIEVHRILRPGLLESAYEECLCHELNLRSVKYRRQCELPLLYKRCRIDCAYRIDLLVEDTVVV
jgi:GxxExxY protein